MNANSRDKFLYRARKDAAAETEKFKDYYDGSAYKYAKTKNMFSNEYDIALSLYVDGFHRGQRGKESMTIVKAVNMNLAPAERMKKDNQFVVCVIKGPKKPKDLYSFLHHLIKDLLNMQNRGVKLQADGLTFVFKVYTSLFLGDIPACADVLFHAGHMSTYGCRICTVKGASYDSRGVYFAQDGVDRPEIRSKESFQQVNIQLSANSEINKGIKKVTPLICFKMFSASFCGLDELHLTGHNLPKQFWGFMQNPNKKYGIANPFEVSPAIIKELGERFAEVQSHVSLNSFEGVFMNLSSRGGHARAVDWQMLLVYLLPNLVCEGILKMASSSSTRNTRVSASTVDDSLIENKLKDTVAAVRCLSSACALALQYEISVEDLEEIEHKIQVWTSFIKENMPPNVHTVTQHYLQHVVYIIKQLGPMRMFSCRPLERMIGMIKQQIGSKSKPAENAFNIAKKFAEQGFISRKDNTTDNAVYKKKVVAKKGRTSGFVRLNEFLYLGAEFIQKCTTFHQNNDNLQVRKIYSVDLYFEGNSSVKLNTKSGKRNVCIAKLPLSDFNGTEENFYVVSIEVMYEVEGESSLFAWARICDNIQVEGYEDRVPVFFVCDSDTPLQRTGREQTYVILDMESIQSPVSTIKSIINDRKHYLIWPKMCLSSKVILKNPPFTFSLT